MRPYICHPERSEGPGERVGSTHGKTAGTPPQVPRCARDDMPRQGYLLYNLDDLRP